MAEKRQTNSWRKKQYTQVKQRLISSGQRQTPPKKRKKKKKGKQIQTNSEQGQKNGRQWWTNAGQIEPTAEKRWENNGQVAKVEKLQTNGEQKIDCQMWKNGRKRQTKSGQTTIGRKTVKITHGQKKIGQMMNEREKWWTKERKRQTRAEKWQANDEQKPTNKQQRQKNSLCPLCPVKPKMVEK